MNSGIDSAGYGAQGSTFRPSGDPIGSFSGHLSHGPTRSPLLTVFQMTVIKALRMGWVHLHWVSLDKTTRRHLV